MGSDQVKKTSYRAFHLLSPFCRCPLCHPGRQQLNAVPADGNPRRVCVPSSCRSQAGCHSHGDQRPPAAAFLPQQRSERSGKLRVTALKPLKQLGG